MKLTVVEQGSAAATGLQIRLEKGHEVERADFLEALAQRGMRQLAPKPVSAETALRRAIEETKPSRLKKFALKRGVWTVHLVYKRVGHQEFPQSFSVKLDDRGLPRITWETQELYGLQEQLESAFSKWLWTYKPTDIGGWFNDLIQRAMDAVPLGGDWWFIPKSKLLIFRQIEEALKSFSGYWLKQNDVTDSDNAAAMVLDGMRERAMAQLLEVETMLNENTEEDPTKLNERTIKARRVRVEVLDKLKAQMKRYEDMFHKPLTDLELKLLELRNRLATTSFMADKAAAGYNPVNDLSDATSKRFGLVETDEERIETPKVEEEAIDPSDPAYRRFALLETDDDKPKSTEEDPEEVEVGRKLDLDDDQ